MADGVRTLIDDPQEYKRELVKVYPLALVQPLSTAGGGVSANTSIYTANSIAPLMRMYTYGRKELIPWI